MDLRDAKYQESYKWLLKGKKMNEEEYGYLLETIETYGARVLWVFYFQIALTIIYLIREFL